MSEEGLSVRGVVVAHGAMAEGLVDAVRRIAGGPADALTAVSNDGAGLGELRHRLEAVASEGPVVIFVDLQTGSCGAAALSTSVKGAECRVICGVNLPILLDFVFSRHLPLDQLVPRLVEKGRGSITPLAASV